ncbi:MAG: hypothetical protein Q7R41_11565 [Phycisphaerales bacterium]|nr:hypothetical protein [Phycisphaerales bacterium]
MKITLTDTDGRKLVAAPPFEGADHVVVEHGKCPACGCAPLKARGQGQTHDHDTYRADAICLECGKPCGVIHVKVSTIFGIEEDERVLNGRCRVY